MRNTIAWTFRQDYCRLPTHACIIAAYHKTILPAFSTDCGLAGLLLRLPVSFSGSSISRHMRLPAATTVYEKTRSNACFTDSLLHNIGLRSGCASFRHSRIFCMAQISATSSPRTSPPSSTSSRGYPMESPISALPSSALASCSCSVLQGQHQLLQELLVT